jgi:hypothetical protein
MKGKLMTSPLLEVQGPTFVLTRKERKTKARQEWDELRDAANERIYDAKMAWKSFRFQVTELFEALHDRTKEPMNRRPPIGLRLIAEGEPKAKVVIVPSIRRDRTGLFLRCDSHLIELLHETTVDSPKGPAKHFQRRLSILNERGWTNICGSIYRTVVSDTERLSATVEDFLSDRRRVLAREHDNCCICGRGLTDPLSRSRGIGPECITRCDCLFCLTDRSIVEPVELTSVS